MTRRRRNATPDVTGIFDIVKMLLPMLKPLLSSIPGIGPILDILLKILDGGGSVKSYRRADRRFRQLTGRSFNQLLNNRSTLPMAAVRRNRSSFATRGAGTDMHVSGCDLVRSIPSELITGDDSIFMAIPANPAYWTGTRIAQLAPGYQQYVPLKFNWRYVPQVAVTETGTVTIGTLWDQSVSSSDLQQTMVTSNGGIVTQCYNAVSQPVRLGSNLQYKLYNLAGDLSATTNPFTLAASAQGTSVVPGYFMIDYHYILKNPIGSAWTFQTKWDTVAANAPTDADDVSIVSYQALGRYGPGTIFHLEQQGWRYHDTAVRIPDNLRCAVFASSQTTVSFPSDSSLSLQLYNPITNEYIEPSDFKFTTPTVQIFQPTETSPRIAQLSYSILDVPDGCVLLSVPYIAGVNGVKYYYWNAITYTTGTAKQTYLIQCPAPNYLTDLPYDPDFPPVREQAAVAYYFIPKDAAYSAWEFTSLFDASYPCLGPSPSDNASPTLKGAFQSTYTIEPFLTHLDISYSPSKPAISRTSRALVLDSFADAVMRVMQSPASPAHP